MVKVRLHGKAVYADPTGLYESIRWRGRPTWFYRRIAEAHEVVSAREIVKGGWGPRLYLFVKDHLRGWYENTYRRVDRRRYLNPRRAGARRAGGPD